MFQSYCFISRRNVDLSPVSAKRVLDPSSQPRMYIFLNVSIDGERPLTYNACIEITDVDYEKRTYTITYFQF